MPACAAVCATSSAGGRSASHSTRARTSVNPPIATAVSRVDGLATVRLRPARGRVRVALSSWLRASCESSARFSAVAACPASSLAWDQQAGKYVYKPLFWNMNVSVPASLSAAWNASVFTNTSGNIMQEVVRGKSTIADYQAAVSNWRKNGGNALRTFYDGIRSKYGDA